MLGGAAALAQAPPSPIKATRLDSHIVLLSGDGGNIAIVTAEDGLMMIDGGYAERAAELQKAVGEQDAHPVRILFNTHWHGDHVGSNEFLGKAGV